MAPLEYEKAAAVLKQGDVLFYSNKIDNYVEGYDFYDCFRGFV